jgi:hypothetical protein
VALNFPNLSRSYDPERRRVRFWAHASAMQILLFLTESALRRLNPHAARTEAAMLATFDAKIGSMQWPTRYMHSIVEIFTFWNLAISSEAHYRLTREIADDVENHRSDCDVQPIVQPKQRRRSLSSWRISRAN